MPAYLIANIHEITDPEKMKAYSELTHPITEDHGGRAIMFDANYEVLEGTSNSARFVVLEFADMATLDAWYTDPRYQPLTKMRQAASRGTLIAVHGTGESTAPTKAPAYLISNTHEILDADQLKKYAGQTGPIMAEYGGKVIVRDTEFNMLEGTGKSARFVVAAFPDMATLKAWYADPRYQPLIKMRQEAAPGTLVALHGA